MFLLNVPEKDMVTVVGEVELVEIPVLLASLPTALVRNVESVSLEVLSV